MSRASGALAGAASSWGNPSALGSAQRGAVELLMSAYDKNAASADHTSAFISALTDAAAIVASGVSSVRIILDTRKKYIIAGPVQAGANGQWAQIPLPFDNAHAGSIKLVGMPRGNDYSYLGGGASGTVIESTLSAAPAFQAARGIASVFGGPASFSSARTPATTYPLGFSYLRFGTENITIRSASPVICGIDAGWLSGFNFDGLLQFDTDAMAAVNPSLIPTQSLWAQLGGAAAICTAPQAIPIIFPFHFDWYGTLGDTLVCAGWLGGPYLGEYAHIRRVIVFASQGAALYLDNSNQATRIEYLTDWNNAYGIASINPAGGTATPVAVPVTAYGSGQGAMVATPVEIGSWEVQTTQNGPGPVASNRVYDVFDPSLLAFIDCPSWVSTDDGGNINAIPIILGNGSSTVGRHSGCRIKKKLQALSGNAAPAWPASGASIRNPYARDALVTIVGGTITSVTVNDGNPGVNSPVHVPANGTIIVTYTAGGSWKWTLI